MKSALETIYGAYMYPCLLTEKLVTLGTNVFSKDWDVLVILDACRVDALREVANEYDFLSDIGAIWSVGSTSKEWYANTFAGPHPAVTETALISGNGWTEPLFETQPNWGYWTATRHSIWHDRDVFGRLLDRPLPEADDFVEYVPVYEDRGGDCGTVALPEDITDAAIHVGRQTEATKLIAHYMQPHEPYLHARDGNSLPEMHADPMKALREGTATKEQVWSAYLDNLRLVLDSVARLRRNIDADRVAITADHGELFGEWGLYSHPAACPHPALRRVPWTTTTAVDHGEVHPDPPTQNVSIDTEQRLADLGYL